MKTLLKVLFGCLLGIALLPYLLIRNPPMPAGSNLASPSYAVTAVDLLVDRTWKDSTSSGLQTDHQIFDRLLTEIEAADDYLILDFFLWNPWKGKIGDEVQLRSLSTQLAAALLRKRVREPEMPILVITDPINKGYGVHQPPFLQELKQAGITVVFTDLEQLPNSNRVYAQALFWRQYLNLPSKPMVPNPFERNGDQFTLQELGRLLYFKANHRKVLIAGKRGQPSTLVVGSLNPADGSANHSNIALAVSGAVAEYAARSELAIARWSALDDVELYELTDRIESRLSTTLDAPVLPVGTSSVAWRSEGAIREELLNRLNDTGAGARVDAAVFTSLTVMSLMPLSELQSGALRSAF